MNQNINRKNDVGLLKYKNGLLNTAYTEGSRFKEKPLKTIRFQGFFAF